MTSLVRISSSGFTEIEVTSVPQNRYFWGVVGTTPSPTFSEGHLALKGYEVAMDDLFDVQAVLHSDIGGVWTRVLSAGDGMGEGFLYDSVGISGNQIVFSSNPGIYIATGTVVHVPASSVLFMAMVGTISLRRWQQTLVGRPHTPDRRPAPP